MAAGFVFLSRWNHVLTVRELGLQDRRGDRVDRAIEDDLCSTEHLCRIVPGVDRVDDAVGGAIIGEADGNLYLREAFVGIGVASVLVGAEEEELVADDWAAYCAAGEVAVQVGVDLIGGDVLDGCLLKKGAALSQLVARVP